MKKRLDEVRDREILDEWYAEARKMPPGALSDFMDHLANDYIHDYGTICHAIAAAGVAAMTAMDRTEQGGITGFQAGCIMWLFIRHWTMEGNKTGMKLVNYDSMLYPQNRESFEKTVDADVWEKIREEAKKKLDEVGADEILTDDPMISHWRSIAEGTPPFGYTVKEGR